MLCAVILEFKPAGRDFQIDALQDVLDLQIGSDHSMEALQAYCSQLDALMLRCMGEQPSVDMLTQKFYEQVRELSPIARDIEDYDRMMDDSPNCCYSWLRIACDRALDRWKTVQHRIVYTAPLHKS